MKEQEDRREEEERVSKMTKREKKEHFDREKKVKISLTREQKRIEISQRIGKI
jgi:hypothetical protein